VAVFDIAYQDLDANPSNQVQLNICETLSRVVSNISNADVLAELIENGLVFLTLSLVKSTDNALRTMTIHLIYCVLNAVLALQGNFYQASYVSLCHSMEEKATM
jgi:hypothetical protein